MENASINLGVIFMFALVGFVYVGWTYRTKDDTFFHTVDRKASITRIVSSLFTVVGASEFVVFTSLAYLFGWQSLFFFVGTLIGFIALARLVPLIRAHSQELDLHSIPDFAAANKMIGISRCLSVLSILFTCCLVLIQILIGTLIIHEILGGSVYIISLLLIVGVVLYLYWGGYHALLHPDVIQEIVLFALTAIMVIHIAGPSIDAGLGVLLYNPDGVPFAELLLLAFGGFFAIFGGPEIWQRVVTSKSVSSAQTGLITSGIVMLLWAVILVLGTLIIRSNFPHYEPSGAFVQFLTSDLPGWMLGVVLLTILAAIMSTADTEIFAAAVIAQKELYRKRVNYHLKRSTTRIILIGLGILVFLMSILTQDILTVYFGLVYITFITGPIALSLLLGRGGRSHRFKRIIYLSTIILSSSYFIVLLIKGLLISWYPLLILVICFLPILIPGEKNTSPENSSIL